MDVASAADFDFTFPSHGGACYASAPLSPARLTELYHGFEALLINVTDDANRSSPLASVPFAWEEKPGVPKTPKDNLLEDDFSFDVSCHFDNEPIPMEYLFNSALIKTVSPSPRGEVRDVRRERGRERVVSTSRLPTSRSRRTRSMSPLGISDKRRPQVAPSTPPPSIENGSKRWSFLDLLLFRSASDGRAMERDPLKKYSANFRKYDQDVRNSGSMSKRRGRVSAHELHYNVNRAVSNDMKKKTYLPYKQGILGRFSFNP